MESPIPFRVAVITPYYREAPEVLQQCMNSVAEQTYSCTHFLVADGHPQDFAGNTDVEHIVLPRAHQDCGNVARAIGSLSAVGQGFDAIAYLDADNWYQPHHIDSLVALHRSSGAIVCTASRTIHRMDGSLMFEDLESDGRQHVDTNCIFLTRSAFRVISAWALMPRQFGAVGDRLVWGIIRGHQYPTAHHSEPTVAYRSQYHVHYEALGEAPPAEAKSNTESTGAAFAWWKSLSAEEQQAWSQQLGITIPW